jgi:DNA-binding LacI/PurR family transcriptional regulator
MKRSIRLSDVADAARVSLGTASNAFNRPELVRPELRELVETAARELGYSGPDPKGRLLMGGKANAIGFVPALEMSVTNAFYSPFLRQFLLGVAEICDEKGASLMVISGAEDRKDWAIRNALVDGFILGHVEEVGLVSVRHRKVPFVVMDLDAGPDVNSVCVKARDGARGAAEHLLALGHRHFAIISVLRKRADPVWHPPGQMDRKLVASYPLDHEKLLGYGDALAAAGISIDDVPVVESYPPSPWAESGARMLFDKAPEATAILAMSDKNAIAVLDVARERGIRVPEDLSVVGFDDSPDAAIASPPLTTVAQPLIEKGKLAARMIFDDARSRHEVLPVKLIVRASTAVPRDAE